MGIYIINEPGFQGAIGPWRGTGAAPLLGDEEGKAPLKLPNFWNFKSSKPPFTYIEISFFLLKNIFKSLIISLPGLIIIKFKVSLSNIFCIKQRIPSRTNKCGLKKESITY